VDIDSENPLVYERFFVAVSETGVGAGWGISDYDYK
jgi:hypothetical protein